MQLLRGSNRWWVAVVGFGLYALVLLLVPSAHQPSVLPFTTAPVLLTGALLGRRQGALAGVFATGLNLALLGVLSVSRGLGPVEWGGFFVGSLMGVLLGGVVGALRDLLVERERLRSRDRALIRALPDGLLSLDHEGRCVELNELAAGLFSPPPRLGQPLTLAGPAPAVATLLEAARALGATGLARVELALGERHVEARLARRGGGVLCVLTDVTAMRAALALQHEEEQLRLETQVELELLRNRQLELVEQLATGLAHQVNSPIAYSLSNLRFVQEELAGAPVSPEVRDALVETQAGVERIERLVKELNAAASVRAGRPRLVSLVELVDSALARVEPMLFGGAQVVRRYEGLERLGPMRAYPDGLREVMVRMLHAAAGGRTTPAAPLSVAVTLSALGEEVRLEVRDSGPTLSADQLTQALEPFPPSSGQSGRETPELFMVRGAIAAMGGRFELEVPPGGGPVQRLWLPRLAPEKARSLERAHVSGARVLIIDDAPVALPSRVTGEHDFDAVVTSSVPEGQRLAAQGGWELVVFGEEAPLEELEHWVRQLKELDSPPHCALALSHRTDDALAFARREGLLVLDKPVLPSAIQQLLVR